MAATKRKNKAKKAEKGKASEGHDGLGGKEYDRELVRLHGELVKLQLWVVARGLKVVIVFEGRDGAGKGGVIKAITERVSPRVYRVVALPAPTER
jgi:polyphosphate kinase